MDATTLKLHKKIAQAKTSTKEIGDNRNVVPPENAINLMDCKKIKRNSITRNRYNKITHEQKKIELNLGYV